MLASAMGAPLSHTLLMPLLALYAKQGGGDGGKGDDDGSSAGLPDFLTQD